MVHLRKFKGFWIHLCILKNFPKLIGKQILQEGYSVEQLNGCFWLDTFYNELVIRRRIKEQPVKHILSCHSNIYESEQFFYIPQCIHFHSLGRFTYDVHENCHIFKTPNSTCPAASKFLPPPWPWTSNFKLTTPPAHSKW